MTKPIRLAQRCERRELDEDAVLDLRDAAGEHSVEPQLVEHLPEGLLVEVTVVVVGLGYSVVAVENPVGAIPGQHPDEVGLEVEADGLVERVVDDDPDGAQVLLLRGVEVLTHSRGRVQRFPDVDVTEDGPAPRLATGRRIIEHADHGPVRVAIVARRPGRDG